MEPMPEKPHPGLARAKLENLADELEARGKNQQIDATKVTTVSLISAGGNWL